MKSSLLLSHDSSLVTFFSGVFAIVNPIIQACTVSGEGAAESVISGAGFRVDRMPHLAISIA